MVHMITKEETEITLRHRPEAENDFVVLSYKHTLGEESTGLLHLTAEEARELADYLTRMAAIAEAAAEAYAEELRDGAE